MFKRFLEAIKLDQKNGNLNITKNSTICKKKLIINYCVES